MKMAIQILMAANSARNEMIEVMQPAPAIMGNASGTTEATFGLPVSCLNIRTPNTISSAKKKRTNEPATAKEFTSMPIR